MPKYHFLDQNISEGVFFAKIFIFLEQIIPNSGIYGANYIHLTLE